MLMKNLRQRPQMKWLVMDMTQLTVGYSYDYNAPLLYNFKESPTLPITAMAWMQDTSMCTTQMSTVMLLVHG